MLAITTPIAPVGMMAIVYLGALFATLSERLNAVAKKSDYQGWFWVANGFITLAAASQVIRGTATLAPEHALSFLLEPWFALISFHVPLAVGVTIDLVLVRYYWGWILKEKSK